MIDTASMNEAERPNSAQRLNEGRAALVEAAQAIAQGDLSRAEGRVRAILATHPDDVEAIRLLAAVARTAGFPEDAIQLLRRAIALSPSFVLAYADLAFLLCRLQRADEAVALLDRAAFDYPGVIWPLSLKAAVFSSERRAEEALAAHEAVVALGPNASIPWMNYALALKTQGRTGDAVSAYRKSLQLDPANGAAWWGLANLRTIRLDAEDVASMERALPMPSDPFQKVQLQFALGKALGDEGRYEESFRHYEAANLLRGTLVPYNAASVGDLVQKAEAILTPEIFARHQAGQGGGEEAIFIVGMPRSGSTLVEQILASHPMVEGLGELFELRETASQMTGRGVEMSALSDALARLGVGDARTLGNQYLLSIRRHRQTDRPYFTDKMPANWQLVPLIRMILPKAKIIDVRRSPMACCFSSFTTYFNRETSFPTNLEDLAAFYRDYADLMTHMDAVLPGQIHRVQYERIVEDLETEVRHLLDFIGLPFDPACLRFHETQRPIHTPSAQQVRQPINQDGLYRWRDYEPWLAPLRARIGAQTPRD